MLFIYCRFDLSFANTVALIPLLTFPTDFHLFNLSSPGSSFRDMTTYIFQLHIRLFTIYISFPTCTSIFLGFFTLFGLTRTFPRHGELWFLSGVPSTSSTT